MRDNFFFPYAFPGRNIRRSYVALVITKLLCVKNTLKKKRLVRFNPGKFCDAVVSMIHSMPNW